VIRVRSHKTGDVRGFVFAGYRPETMAAYYEDSRDQALCLKIYAD
jgi:hypothetical protein